jgi:hypothetical protein
MPLSRVIVVALAATVAGALAQTAHAVAPAHDGSFASVRRWFLTRLDVLEGTAGAVVQYSGLFGPGCPDQANGGWCRSCGLGAAYGLRESSSTYVIATEEGKARLSLEGGAWRLRLIEGTAGWCGVGWSGDEFRPRGSGLKRCGVVVDGAELAEPDRPARYPVTRGERLAALDVLPTDDRQLLVKMRGLVGVMRRTDVRCGVR